MTQTTTYQRTKQGQNFTQEALTKAIVYFTDGNSRKFHSRDKSQKVTIPNKDLGIFRLKKMISVWGDKVQKAIIYDCRTEEELCKFKDGTWS